MKISCADPVAGLPRANSRFRLKTASRDTDRLPNDPLSDRQWAWEKMNLNPGLYSSFERMIRVAVIDTGINYLHEDLTESVLLNTGEVGDNGLDDDRNGFVDDVLGWNAFSQSGDVFDHQAHGTEVAGVIAAGVDNGIGITGGSPRARLIPIKIFSPPDDETSLEAVVRAFDYAVARKAEIINVSWSSSEDIPFLKEIFQELESRGILVVTAVGNDAQDNDLSPRYPSAYETKTHIRVASSDVIGGLSDFSNFGKNSVDVAAPGEAILTTLRLHRYGLRDGTSLAAPHVTAFLSNLMLAFPALTPQELIQWVLAHCERTDRLAGKNRCGGYLRAP